MCYVNKLLQSKSCTCPTFYLTFMWIMIEVSTSLGYITGLQVTVGH